MALRRRRRSRSLAAQSLEMGLASSQVILHRMARMARADAVPSARDAAEFQLMVTEKIAAADEAWAAMAAQAMVESQKLALHMMQSLWFPWMYPPPTAKAVSRRLNAAAAGVLGKGMAPIRRRAVANARRLGLG